MTSKLAQEIRRLRTKAGLSQAKVGQGLLTRAAVSAIEHEKVRPSVETLDILTAGLGLPEGDLYALYLEETAEPGSLLQLARRAFETGHDRVARRALGKLIRSDRKRVHKTWTVPALLALAHHFQESGQASKADRAAESLIRQEGLDRPGPETFEALLLQARARQAAGDPAGALQSLLFADQLLRRAEGGPQLDPLALEVQFELGLTAYDLGAGTYPVAFQAFQQALGLAPANDPVTAGRCHMGLALIHWRRDEWSEAVRHGQAALDRFEAAGDIRRVAQAENNLGVFLSDAGNIEEAKVHLLVSLRLKRTQGDRTELLPTLNELAELSARIEDWESFEKYVKEAEDLLDTAPASWRAAALRWAGLLRARNGDLVEGIGMIRQSLIAFGELKDVDGLYASTKWLSSVLADQGIAREDLPWLAGILLP